MEISMKKYRTSPDLKVEFLGFREKFTILRKVIVNTLKIELSSGNNGIPAHVFSNNLAKVAGSLTKLV